MKMSIKKVLAVVMALALVVTCFAACGETASTEKVLKIGGIGPTTGGAAVYGQAVKNGAELAVAEINAAGGINGVQIEFQWQDDEHDAEKAVNAYNTLKDWGMQILVGTVTTAPCLSVIESTNADNIFQITPSASAADCVKYDNCFQVCFTDPNQGVASADYIADNGLATKVAVIYNSSDAYSSGIYNNFKTEAAAKNLAIVAEEAFTSDSSQDFSVQLNAAKSAGADLVFLPIYAQEASLILQQAKTIGYETKFFGCDGLDGVLSIDGFDASLAEGVMLLTPFARDASDEATQKFVAAYDAQYAPETLNQFGADAYDAVYIIKAAAEKANINADMTASEICDALKEVMPQISIDGVTGTGMSWAATGEVNKSPKAVKIVDGSYVSMD